MRMLTGEYDDLIIVCSLMRPSCSDVGQQCHGTDQLERRSMKVLAWTRSAMAPFRPLYSCIECVRIPRLKAVRSVYGKPGKSYFLFIGQRISQAVTTTVLSNTPNDRLESKARDRTIPLAGHVRKPLTSPSRSSWACRLHGG